MYIEYVTPQRVADPNYTEYDSKGGKFKPRWLIRTSNWQKVPGTDAVGGYHALSYCWTQSGEVKKLEIGGHICVDNGYHEITREKDGARNSCYATYNDLLQQICKDFDIEYLWYDKICIDQTDKAEKLREIKQMHLIYSNARYTVALVPEIYIKDLKHFDCVNSLYGITDAKREAIDQMLKSLWFQRSWTLEEVMMSTQILVVGRNTHFWSLATIKEGDKIKEKDILAGTMLGFKERGMKSASQVLHYAHKRTSTKEHDKIFALANIFADLISIDADYSSGVSATMNAFYRRLAQKDLSLMCFGSILFPNGEPMFKTYMGSYGLPSWTGVAGLHSLLPIADITQNQNCGSTIDENMVLYMRCRYYTIRPSRYSNFDVFKDDERKKKADENYLKVISSKDDFGNESEALDWSQWVMNRAVGYFATHYYKPDNPARFLSPVLPLSLTEECDECVVLDIVFNSAIKVTADNVFVNYSYTYLSPVARKLIDGSYKIIGTILLKYFQYNEPRISPQEALDKMFDNLCSEITRDFCIK